MQSSRVSKFFSLIFETVETSLRNYLDMDHGRRLIHINAAVVSLLINIFMNDTYHDDRERDSEGKFVRDRSHAFKVEAQRNVLLSRWAAIRMGLHGKAAEDYVADLAAADAVPRVIVTRVMNDLLARGVPAKRLEIESEIRRFTAKARAQIVRGTLR
jgi:hypothetical protein